MSDWGIEEIKPKVFAVAANNKYNLGYGLADKQYYLATQQSDKSPSFDPANKPPSRIAMRSYQNQYIDSQAKQFRPSVDLPAGVENTDAKSIKTAAMEEREKAREGAHRYGIYNIASMNINNKGLFKKPEIEKPTLDIQPTVKV